MKPFIILKKDSKTVVVPDDFSLSAPIFHIFWILYHKLWHLLLIFGLYIASVAYLHNYNVITDNLYYFGIILSLIYLWIYGNFWRQLKYRKRGYVIKGMIIAKNEAEAFYRAL